MYVVITLDENKPAKNRKARIERTVFLGCCGMAV
jgi:hypothetical protein